jgi:tetratricopeptide (TPR) repeat protein
LQFPASPAALAFSPDGKRILTGSLDKTARLWEVATGNPVRRPAPLQHPGAVTAVAFSRDGKTLLTGTDARTVHQWDARTGQPLGQPLRHPHTVWAVAFSPDGSTIVTGCEDRCARLWRAVLPWQGKPQQLRDWIEANHSLAWSGEGEVRLLDGPAWKARLQSLPAGGASGVPEPDRDFSWHQRQALVSIEAGDPNAALWHLDRGLKIQPRDWFAAVLRTRIHVQANRRDLAEVDWAQAVKCGPPEQLAAWNRLFTAESAVRKQWSTVLWYLDRRIAAQPKDGDSYVERGEIYRQRNDLAKAVADYSQAIAFTKPPDPRLWRERGRMNAELGKWDQVAADFAQALELLPPDPNQFGERSQVCNELAAWDKAISKALKRRPRDTQLRVALGRRYAQLSQWAEAAPHYAAVIESRPAQDDTFEHACLRLLVDDRAGYQRFCKKLAARAGETRDPFTAFVLARICGLASGAAADPERAVDWGKQAVASSPRTAWYLHALALAHLRAGQYRQAIKQFEASLQENWEGVHVLNELGLALAYQKLGETKKARDWLDKAVRSLKRLKPKSAKTPVTLPATDWLEAEVLRREAEDLIKGSGSASRK